MAVRPRGTPTDTVPGSGDADARGTQTPERDDRIHSVSCQSIGDVSLPLGYARVLS